ncbi:hypothetical protein HJFPF1_11438 [Paramyrothecium foliicola]|nr:hypothetical protein HJFPF1_11438 [Paramyrothecium foliicola]
MCQRFVPVYECICCTRPIPMPEATHYAPTCFSWKMRGTCVGIITIYDKQSDDNFIIACPACKLTLLPTIVEETRQETEETSSDQNLIRTTVDFQYTITAMESELVSC